MFPTGHGKKSISSSASSSSASSSFSSSSSSSFISLQIKEDDKFFSKLLSREESSSLDHVNNSSHSWSKALYYGEKQGSVPFTWESRPGTPKNPTVFPKMYPVHDTVPDLIPPLTPPPSSYSSSPSTLSSPTPKSTNENFLRRKQHNLSLTGIVSRVKTTTSGSLWGRSRTLSLSNPSLCTWTGSSSSGLVSYSSASTASKLSCEKYRSRSRHQCGLILSNVDIGSVYLDDYDDNNVNDDCASSSPDSTLKFSSRRKHCFSGNKFWACTPVVKVKRVFLSIVGHRPSSPGHAA